MGHAAPLGRVDNGHARFYTIRRGKVATRTGREVVPKYVEVLGVAVVQEPARGAA